VDSILALTVAAQLRNSSPCPSFSKGRSPVFPIHF